jgi:hypothetical protein
MVEGSKRETAPGQIGRVAGAVFGSFRRERRRDSLLPCRRPFLGGSAGLTIETGVSRWSGRQIYIFQSVYLKW